MIGTIRLRRTPAVALGLGTLFAIAGLGISPQTASASVVQFEIQNDTPRDLFFYHAGNTDVSLKSVAAGAVASGVLTPFPYRLAPFFEFRSPNGRPWPILVTVQMSHFGVLTSCSTNTARVSCEMTTVPGIGKTRLIVSAAQDTEILYSSSGGYWDSMVIQCLGGKYPELICTRRDDWAWEIHEGVWTYYLDNVTWSGLSEGTAGKPYLATLRNPQSENFATSVTNLPAGLTFDAATNVIAGTPKTAGTTSIRLSLVAQGGSVASTRVVPFTVKLPAPTITTTTFDLIGTPPATVGQPFNRPIVFDGFGLATKVSATGLPPGLTIVPNGSSTSGKPTTAGTYSVKLTVTTAGGTATKTIPLTVRPAP